MAKKILFLLGSANISGGTYVILQHAQHLQKLGYEVVIALVFMKTEEYLTLKHSPECWHPAIKELSFISIDDAKEYYFDIAIFTWWATLFSFEKINASSYVYFVQSIESRFYEKHQSFLRRLVENTYKIGLPAITEATWIQNVLLSKYNNCCELVKNGMLKSLYTVHGEAYAKKTQEQLRILVEGPIDVAFKNVEKTLELCRRANVGEIWLLTSSKVSDIPGVSRVFSQVPITQVPNIYRSCDVIVKLSYVEGMFGPPLEMFHCGGTAIVYDVTGYDEYIIHDVNALVAKTDDEETVVNYLHRLHQDRSLLSRLTAGAQETAKQWISWVQSSNAFGYALEKLANESKPNAHIHRNINVYLKEHIDIVIVKDNQQVENTLTANPLYDNGYYALNIPISKGSTRIGIAFGKCYQRVLVTRINICNVAHPQTKVKCNISCIQMIQESNGIYESQSKSGMLVLDVDLTDDNATLTSHCNFQVEFHPLSVWENQMEKELIAEL